MQRRYKGEGSQPCEQSRKPCMGGPITMLGVAHSRGLAKVVSTFSRCAAIVDIAQLWQALLRNPSAGPPVMRSVDCSN